MSENPFQLGSMAHIIYESKKYDDILYVMNTGQLDYSIKIVCKPNYSVDQVKQFIDNTMLISMDYEVVVENTSEGIE